MSDADLEAFITRWSSGDGGQERANYAPFLIELCGVLGVPRPEPASFETETNAYVFERAVTFREPDGSTSRGRIDLYKRGSFVLEAKQSRRPGTEKARQSNLFEAGPEDKSPRGKRTTSRAWDVLMVNARRQAEDYAKALPASEGWPPFLIICDVGHCFEIFADFSGQGKNYAQFPDRQNFRLFLEDLHDEKIRERLRLIWLDPHKLDPTKIAAQATRKIAERLAKVSKHLEEAKSKDGKKLYDPEQVALFLMRCLFTMFAEDVELLPKDSFRDVLQRCTHNPDLFPRLVGQLWEAMDKGDFAYAIEKNVRRFNGYLFKDRTVLPLPRQEIGELLEAAKADWREVEPAIFGTLLEQALDPAERKKLGAHYTPRAYVERLVTATILEPLRAEWATIQATVEGKRAEGDAKGAAALVRDFHARLCELRILDPACGTGNFLYVALELLKRLEGEVLEALSLLSDQASFSGYELKTIDPHQFLGLEINPRAKAIAELVLWIGFLQWHFRIRGGMPPEPILRDFKTIEVRDAVLDYDEKELVRDEHGRPMGRKDSSGNDMPVYRYKNPRRPDWPEADFIVGNPPFIGGKDLRGRLGEDYAKALWAAHPHMNESADFVMYWWDYAADLLARKGTRLKRFGLVTTNSLSQVFQRRVMERHFSAKHPISLIMAIPDHPWTKATRDSAAVRIAMTVAEAGAHDGRLLEVVKEEGLDTDEPVVELRESLGKINSDLTVGVDVTGLPNLKANKGMAHKGFQLNGDGFIVSLAEAELLLPKGSEHFAKPYFIGRDINQRNRGLFALDFFPLSAGSVRNLAPQAYQHLLENVEPERRHNAIDYRRENWWLFGQPSTELRDALSGLSRFIVTARQGRHRIFSFAPCGSVAESTVVVIANEDSFVFGVLQSYAHEIFSLRAGGWLGVGNDTRYFHTRTFNPFPFPDPPPNLKDNIRATAEELDSLRKRVQADHPNLTLTQIYNVLEKLRAGATLNPQDEAIKTRGLVLILKELHEKLDGLVAEAYGWPKNLTDEKILEKLVALNKERAEEERRGLIRWLRPDYQRARAGIAPEPAKPAEEQIEAPLVVAAEKAQKNLFPKDDVERTAAVLALLMRAASPLDANAIAASFRQGAKITPIIARILSASARVGFVQTADNGTFAARRVA